MIDVFLTDLRPLLEGITPVDAGVKNRVDFG